MTGLPPHYYRSLIENALDVVIVTEAEPLSSPGPRIVYVNPAFTRLTGYRPDEVIGTNPRILQRAGQTDPTTTAAIRAALEAKRPFDGVIRNFDRDGRGYWLDLHIIPLLDDSGDVAFFAAIERDVTEEQVLLERLSDQANRDVVTGLLNGRALHGAITDLWDRTLDHDPPHSVITIDVDDFKSVNDRYGHATGDATLVGVADAIRTCVRDGDFAVRLGGDEFAVILPRISTSDAATIAERIRRGVPAACAEAAERGRPVTVSLGVASSTPHATTLRAVMELSDAALYAAKRDGKNVVAEPSDDGPS